MKSTGIIRRIDDLGRVAIPKEIRRTLRIKEGDPLEVYTTSDGGVVFKKYSILGDITNLAQQLCEAAFNNCGTIAAVTDRDSFIAVTGGVGKRDLLGKRISTQLEQAIDARRIWQYTDDEDRIFATDLDDKYQVATIAPVISEGELIGSVLFVWNKGQTSNETELALSKTIASFLGKQLEI